MNLIGITTYLKNDSLDVLINSLIEHGYTDNARIVIADDDSEAVAIYNKYRKDIKITYIGGNRAGICGNKSRIIHYFLKNTKYENLLLLDDDLVFHKSGFIEQCLVGCEDINLPFISGYWTDHTGSEDYSVSQTSGNSWVSDFPCKGSTKFVSLHQGKHGCTLFFKREAIEKAGFYNKMGFYGYEHSLYFSRLLKLYGWSPELFPILKYCDHWYKGQNVPNRYTIDIQEVHNTNGQEHIRLLKDVYEGKGLTIMDNQFRKVWKKDRLLES